MREVLEDLVDSASRHATYADVRHVCLREQTVALRHGELARSDDREEAGIGVRVRAGGGWAFAAARGSERAAGEEALARALALAAARPSAAESPLAPEPAATGSYVSPTQIDPLRSPSRTSSRCSRSPMPSCARSLVYRWRARTPPRGSRRRPSPPPTAPCASSA